MKLFISFSVEPKNQKLKRSSSFKRVIILMNDNATGVFQFSQSSLKNYIIEVGYKLQNFFKKF